MTLNRILTETQRKKPSSWHYWIFSTGKKDHQNSQFFWLSFVYCIVSLEDKEQLGHSIDQYGYTYAWRCWENGTVLVAELWYRAVVTQVLTCSSSRSLQPPCLPDYGRSSPFTKLISSGNMLSHSVTYSTLLAFSITLLVLVLLWLCPFPKWDLSQMVSASNKWKRPPGCLTCSMTKWHWCRWMAWVKHLTILQPEGKGDTEPVKKAATTATLG